MTTKDLAEALRELIALKDLKEGAMERSIKASMSKGANPSERYHEWNADYKRRNPLAWDAARVALASHDAAQSASQEDDDGYCDHCGENPCVSRAAPAAVAEPAAKFLLVAQDDDGFGNPVFCKDEAEVSKALLPLMFFLQDGEVLDADHAEQFKANLELLLEDGCLNFEGDPSVLLYRLRPGAATPPLTEPITSAEVVLPEPHVGSVLGYFTADQLRAYGDARAAAAILADRAARERVPLTDAKQCGPTGG